MFKNLKEKLGADGLSATASSFAQQIRTGASGTSNDISSYTRKFLNAVQSEALTPPHNNVQDGLREESLDNDNATVSDIEFMHNISDGDFNAQSDRAPRSRSELLNASVESTPENPSQVFAFALKEFPALQSYKDRFNAVNLNYNKLVKENKKLRNILTQTQDISQKRSEMLLKNRASLSTAIKEAGSSAEDTTKIEAVFKQFEETIQNQQAQIDQLKAENEKLQKQNTIEDIEKVNAEWKGRIDRINEKFVKKLSVSEEMATFAIAQSKAENHSLLQQKDQEIEKWINKCHVLEKTDSDINQKFEQQIKDLHHTISALEIEKADIVEKLSQAKQQGIKLVHEEEEEKRVELISAYDQKLSDAEKRINKLNQRCANLEVLEKSVADLKASLHEKDVENILNELKKAETETQQQKIDFLEAELNNKEKHINEAEEKINALINEAETLKSTHAGVQNVKYTYDAAQEFRTFFDDFEEKLNQTNFDKIETQKKLAVLRESATRLEKLLDHKSQEVESLKEKVAKFDAERSEIELDAFNQYHKDSGEQMSNVQANLDELLVPIFTLQDSVTEKEAKLLDYRNQIEDISRVLFTKSKEILEEKFGDDEQNQFAFLSLTEQVDYFVNVAINKVNRLEKIPTLEETIKNQADEIKKLDVELTAVTNTVANANAALAKVEELHFLSDKSSDLTKNISDVILFIKEKSRIERQLNEEKDRRDTEIQSELSTSQSKVQLLHYDYDILKQKYDAAIERRDILENEKAELTFQLEHQNNDAQDKINKLLELNEEFKQKKDDLVSKVEIIVGDLPHGVTVYDKLSELGEFVQKLEETIAQSQKYSKANERLTRENGEYQAEMEFITQTLESFKLQGQLHEQTEALVERLNQRNATVSELEASLKVLKEKNEFLEHEITMLKDNQKLEINAEKSALTTALENTKTRIVDLESRNEMVIAALEDLRTYADLPKFVNAVVSTVTGDTEELRNHVSALVEKHLTAQKRFKNVEKEAGQLKEQVEELMKRQNEKQQQYTGLQKNHEDLRTRYMEKEKVVEELNAQIVQLEISLKKRRLEKQSVIDELDSQKIAAARDAMEVNRLKNELEANEATKKKYVEEVFNFKKELSVVATSVNEERETALQELANVREELVISKTTAAKAISNLHDLEQRLKESDEKAVNAAAFEAKLKQVQAELSLKEGDASLANKKVELFEQEKIALQATVEQLQSSLAKTQSELEKISEEKSALATQLQEVQVDRVQNETNTRKIKAVEKHIRDVCRNLEEKTIKLETANIKIRELEQTISETQTEENGFSANDNAFHADLDEVDFLRGENENLRAENATLLNKIKTPKNSANQINGVDPLEMRSVVKQQAAFNHESLSFISENMGVVETEAEYLRNVIYNYMAGRELYGQQCVALAKVIIQILKFTPQQQAEILRKEESRVNHGWSM